MKVFCEAFVEQYQILGQETQYSYFLVFILRAKKLKTLKSKKIKGTCIAWCGARVLICASW